MAKLPEASQLQTREPQPGMGVASYNPSVIDAAAPGLGYARAQESVAQTIGKGANELLTAIAKKQEEVDTTRVEDAWNQYRTAALDTTMGENGALKLKGSEAVNAPGGLLSNVTSTMETQRKAIESNLTNDDQKRRFAERANATDLQVKTQVIGHLASEQQAYAQTVQEGSVKTAMAEVRAAPTDETVFEGQMKLIEGKTTAYLKAIGKNTPEFRDEYLRNVKDTMIANRIETLLYDRPEIAETRFRNLADQISDPKLRREYQARTTEVAFNVTTVNDAKKLVDETHKEFKTGPNAVISDVADREAGLKEVNLLLKKDPNNAELQAAKVAWETAPTQTEFKNTNGLPTAKDVKAQLPIALAKIPAEAERRGYRKDTPEYAAYIKRTEAEVTSIISKESAQLTAIQKENMDALKDYLMGPVMGSGSNQGAGGSGTMMKVTSWAGLVSNPDMARRVANLDSDSKIALANTIKSFANEEGKGDAALLNEFRNRLYLPEGDPQKLNSWTQIMTDPRVSANALTTAQITYLNSEFTRAQTEDGRSYANVRKGGETLAKAYFNNPMKPTKILGLSDTAAALWAQNADKVVSEYNKAGKDIRGLFDPNNKDGLATPQVFERFVREASGVSTTAEALAIEAKKVQQAANTPPAQPKNEAEYNALPPGTVFVDPTGKRRTKPGTAPVSSAAETQTPAAAASTGTPLPAGTIRYNPQTMQIETTGEPAAAPAPAATATTQAPAIPQVQIPKFANSMTPEQSAAADIRMSEILDTHFKAGEWVAKSYMKVANRVFGTFAQTVGKLKDAETQKSVEHFREIVAGKTPFIADANSMVTINNFLASGKGTPTENAQAQAMMAALRDSFGMKDRKP